MQFEVKSCPKCGAKNDTGLGQEACFRCGADLPTASVPHDTRSDSSQVGGRDEQQKSSSAAEWFYVVREERRGPVSEQELIAAIESVIPGTGLA